MNPLFENLFKMLIPLLAQYALGQMAEPVKRILFVNVAALGEEGQAFLKKTQTELDDMLFDKLVESANAEFAAAGKADLGTWLDEFVQFKTG